MEGFAKKLQPLYTESWSRWTINTYLFYFDKCLEHISKTD